MGKAQDMVRGVMEEQGLSFSPEVRMLDLVSETGELAKEWLKGTGYGQREFTHTPGLEEEVGDCLFSFWPCARPWGWMRTGAGRGPGEIRPAGPGDRQCGQRAVEV